jgi:hypothetical protein
MWALAGLLAIGLTAYVVLLMQLNSTAAERAQKVRYLDLDLDLDAGSGASRQAFAGYGEPEPAYLLRRSAN